MSGSVLPVWPVAGVLAPRGAGSVLEAVQGRPGRAHRARGGLRCTAAPVPGRVAADGRRHFLAETTFAIAVGSLGWA